MAQNLGYMDFADQVQVATLGDTLIIGGYLNTDLIKAKSIFTDHLAVGAVTADKINVADLSAIAGKFSDLMAGTAGGARLELGEVGGNPFLEMYDSAQTLRVEMLQDKIGFRDELGRYCGAVNGIRYNDAGYDAPMVLLEGHEYVYAGASPGLKNYMTGDDELVFGGVVGHMEDGLPTAMLMAVSMDPELGWRYATLSVREGIKVQTLLKGKFEVDVSDGFYYLNHPTSTSAATCRIDTEGRFFRSTSAAKYKTNIESIEEDRAEAFFEKCQPSWYRSLCEGDRKDWSWYGYVADEVAKVEPRLVDFNKDGEPEGFAYDHVAPLLHVVIKHNRKMIEGIEERLDAIEKQLATNKK